MNKTITKNHVAKMWKGLFLSLLVLFASLCFWSCSDDDETDATDYDISELYGYTYYGNITASSGSTLIPSLLIYNDERCDWNMSVNGMNNNQFYYYGVKNSTANYTLYWYSAENVAYCKTKDTSKASMTIQLGINSSDEIVILLTGDDLTGVSGMTNTRVSMKKQADKGKNTTPPEINFESDIEDVKIKIPDTATASNWTGANSYAGTFVYMVGNPGNIIQKGKGNAGKAADGTPVTPEIKITATENNTVKITMHTFSYTEQMTIDGYDIPDVSVKTDGNVLYLYRAKSSDLVIEEKTLTNLTVSGKLENGVLTLRVSYAPGKMPFPITEIFTSN